MKVNLAVVKLNPSRPDDRLAPHVGRMVRKGLQSTIDRAVQKTDAAQSKRIADVEKAVQHHEVLLTRLIDRVNRLDGQGGSKQQPPTPASTSIKRTGDVKDLRKDTAIKPVRGGEGKVDEIATLIKGIHKKGPRR